MLLLSLKEFLDFTLLTGHPGKAQGDRSQPGKDPVVGPRTWPPTHNHLGPER